MKAITLNSIVVVLIAALATGLNAKSDTGDRSIDMMGTQSHMTQELSQEAVAYYHKLTASLTDFKKADYAYIQAVMRTRNARSVEKGRQGLLNVVQSNIDFYKSCSSFHNDSTLKSELIHYIDIVKIILEEDFGKILDMEDIAAQSYDKAEAHQLAVDQAIKKMHESFDVLKKAETDFFKKYQITVTEVKDELTLKIEKANKACEYYVFIQRIFFKANKQNFYANTAVESKDIAGLEQHATTLVSFSEEGQKQLKKNEGYEGDKDLVTNVIQILEFYREAGQVTYPANIDFMLKTDSFEKASKKMNSIKESDRKQTDVDQYNNAVNIFNKAAKEINKINNEYFKEHKELLELWNKQVDKFFEKHS
jgi:hypothetical protein